MNQRIEALRTCLEERKQPISGSYFLLLQQLCRKFPYYCHLQTLSRSLKGKIPEMNGSSVSSVDRTAEAQLRLISLPQGTTLKDGRASLRDK